MSNKFYNYSKDIFSDFITSYITTINTTNKPIIILYDSTNTTTYLYAQKIQKNLLQQKTKSVIFVFDINQRRLKKKREREK